MSLVPREAYLGAPDVVAPLLLGKLLVRRFGDATLVGRVVETEAYFGTGDPAAHAFSGRTARTEVLFGPPGHAYVYRIYGIHACLNVSCEPEGEAGCVLIRALQPLEGLQTMGLNRGLGEAASPAALTAGPGRLCQAMAVSREEHNGMDLTVAESSLQIREDGFVVECIAITPRIGVNKAAERPLRFTVAKHGCVSRGRYWRPGDSPPRIRERVRVRG